MVTNPPEKTIAVALARESAPAGDARQCGLRTACREPVLAVRVAFHYAGRSLQAALNSDMGHRLSKIVTRTGDAGTTGLGDGSRVAKDSQRIEAIGAVDELNSTLGLLLSETLSEPCASVLIDVQHDLFGW